MAEMTPRGVLQIAAAGATAALPGVIPSPAHSQGTQKLELVVAQGGDVAQFDPHMSTSSNDIRISFNLFDNLTSRRPDGKLAPGLATEWKLQGQTTWVFKRSEEHTSELQSLAYIVCRLLLEKKRQAECF